MNAVADKQEKTIPQNTITEAPRGYVSPAVNIIETADAYILEAEVPGVARDGLSLTVENEVLTLVGRRQFAPEGTRLYGESWTRDYRRAFALDPTIDTSKIAARVEQGVVTVTLPKAEKAKPQRITVN